MERLLAVVLTSFLLIGCASGVKRDQTDPSARVALTENNQISTISISLTDNAQKKASENLKFDPNILEDHVQRAMDANSLIAHDSQTVLSSLEIQVKDIRVRSNFSAIMWGFMAGSDSITADIVLKQSNGTELDRFEVSVSYALGGLAGGQDDARMGWLYEKFAEETVNELTNRKNKG